MEKSEKPREEKSQAGKREHSHSQLGRNGKGLAGENWSESPEVAKKGRYTEGKTTQGESPDRQVDTDASQAV